MLRLSLALVGLLLCSPLWAGERSLRLGLITNVPEANGALLSWNYNRSLALQGTYSWPLPVHVEVGVPSKKLMSQGEFAIRSPDLDLPFDIDFGPQYSFGGLWFPWSGSFYLGLSAAHRVVTIKSHVASTLIFEDSNTRTTSNTSIAVDLATRTQQDLVRAQMGQRFQWGPVFFGWYLGAVAPASAHSEIDVRVDVQNSSASDSSQGHADNLEEARLTQERQVHEKAKKLLHDFERQTLPLIGLELGWAF